MTGISLSDAIDGYLGSITGMEPRGQRQYAKALAELVAAHPGSYLQDFEPPAGTERARAVLDGVWGSKAERSYNKAVSIFRVFFAWAVEHGHLAADPGIELHRRHEESESRIPFTDDECARILAANPEPRDAFLLRLLFAAGPEASTLQRLRFGDFDPARKEVTFTLRAGRRHLVVLDDDRELWREFARLREWRDAADEEALFPRESPRVGNRKPGKLPARTQPDTASRYLRLRLDGRWETVVVKDPTVPSKTHGIFNWWYRCLWRAEIVEPGTTRGVRMSRARFTASRRLYAKGGLPEVRRVLGVSRSGTSSEVHANADADRLERTRRHVRHELRPVSRNVLWWKVPILTLIDYVTQERDIVELSRVSIEVLSAESADSAALKDAADALTRAVRPTIIIERAKKESQDDHSLIHGHSLVAVWSALETMAVDVTETWLTQRGPAGPPAAPGTKLPKLERLLDPAGLSGHCDPVLTQNLFEIQQIRHVFAHKRGRADSAFVKACPHLGYAVNQLIAIDRETWTDVLVSALLYADTVARRMKQQLGFAAGRALPPKPIF